MAESRRNPTPRFIEIEAPLALEEGQNFYDQEPFSKVVQQYSPNLGYFAGEGTKIIITNIVSNFFKEYSDKSPDQITKSLGTMGFTESTVDNIRKSMYHYIAHAHRKLPRAERPAPSDVDTLSNAWYPIFKALAPFPHWIDYVAAKRDTAFYKPNGDYQISSPWKYRPTPTYAAWLSDRVKRRGNMRLWGIQEVFPEQEAIDTVRELGKSGASRRWRILSASDITQEKR
jgi:hypothetical protein